MADWNETVVAPGFQEAKALVRTFHPSLKQNHYILHNKTIDELEHSQIDILPLYLKEKERPLLAEGRGISCHGSCSRISRCQTSNLIPNHCKRQEGRNRC